MEKKDIYIGFVSDVKVFESGVRKYGISFKASQLDELKGYLTEKNQVQLDFIIKADDGAFISVFNPHTATPKKASVSAATADDLPF
jgi:hypothetical protein